jgi:hypothetical protein
MCQFLVLINLNLIAMPLSRKEKNICKHIDWTRRTAAKMLQVVVNRAKEGVV